MNQMRTNTYVVLSKTGHVHCFDDSDASECVLSHSARAGSDSNPTRRPKMSLFLPVCMLGPAPEAGAMGFWIGGNKSVKNKFEARMKGSLHLGAREVRLLIFLAFTFAAR